MGPRLTFIAVAAAVTAAASQATSPQVTLQLDSDRAGRSPAHRVTVAVRAGDPEVFRATLLYPEAFRFTGFRNPRAPETAVGSYEVDVDLDGTPERSLPLLAASASVAYVDSLGDGRFNPATDPQFLYSGGSRFELRLPFGGDANPQTRTAAFGARATLTLASGLIVSPALGGLYRVLGEVVTVDPDTGDGDDGSGDAPQATRFEVPLQIVGPVVVPFARFSLDSFDLKPDSRDRVRFMVRGRAAAGAGRTAFNPATDNVKLAIDWLDSHAWRCPGHRCGHRLLDRGGPPPPIRAFSQTVSGAAFEPAGHGWHFRGNPPGIERFWLWADGRFHIDIRDLTLMSTGRIAAVTLTIGNHRGTATTVTGPQRDRW
jgi:hypothetical protein